MRYFITAILVMFCFSGCNTIKGTAEGFNQDVKSITGHNNNTSNTSSTHKTSSTTSTQN